MQKIIVFIISFYMMILTCAAEIGSDYPKTAEQKKRESFGSILGGDGGFQLFGGKKSSTKSDAPVMTTNKFLWNAALEVIHFMPIASTDFNGGTITTDWYEDRDLKDVKYKVNIFIKSSQLNANSLTIKVFKKKLKDGRWRDIKTSNELEIDLEDKIIAKARELKIAQEETQQN